MTKSNLLLAFYLLSATCFAQVTVKEKVASGAFLGTVQAHTTNNQVMISWHADDMQYQHVVKLITVFYGEPSDFVTFCDDLLAFSSDYDAGASTDIANAHVILKKELGALTLHIWEKDEYGGLNGYRNFTPKQIEKLKARFLKWASKKGITV